MSADDRKITERLENLLRETSHVPPPSAALRMRILRQTRERRGRFIAMRIAPSAPRFSFWARGALLAASFLFGVVLQMAGFLPLPDQQGVASLFISQTEMLPAAFTEEDVDIPNLLGL